MICLRPQVYPAQVMYCSVSAKNKNKIRPASAILHKLFKPIQPYTTAASNTSPDKSFLLFLQCTSSKRPAPFKRPLSISLRVAVK